MTVGNYWRAQSKRDPHTSVGLTSRKATRFSWSRAEITQLLSLAGAMRKTTIFKYTDVLSITKVYFPLKKDLPETYFSYRRAMIQFPPPLAFLSHLKWVGEGRRKKKATNSCEGHSAGRQNHSKTEILS